MYGRKAYARYYNMNPNGVMDLLNLKQKELSDMTSKLFKFGEEKAIAEKIYRQELRKELLLLRSHKMPTTIINNLAKGKEEIAELRLKRDIAESKYYTCLSAIENKRLEIEVLRSKLTWLREEFYNS